MGHDLEYVHIVTYARMGHGAKQRSQVSVRDPRQIGDVRIDPGHTS